MISQQAQDALDFIVTGALKNALSASPDDHCEIEALSDVGDIKERKAVMLTVSSYLFRVVTLIYFTLNNDTQQHFAAINRAEPETMGESDYLDVIGECGNIFCGALNRELAHHFPHLGMSTPNVLDRECVNYLHELEAGYIKHFKITINYALTLHASLCVCDFADIDFTVDMTQTEESNGELEMF